MGSLEKMPSKVRQAILSGDVERLKHMSRAGNKKAAEKRLREQEILAELKDKKEDMKSEAALLNAQHFTLSDEGDILPPRHVNH